MKEELALFVVKLLRGRGGGGEGEGRGRGGGGEGEGGGRLLFCTYPTVVADM